jgi:hypothetical protein
MEQESDSLSATEYIVPILYTLICTIGIIGNGIVIYVILYTSSFNAAQLYQKLNTITTHATKNYIKDKQQTELIDLKKSRKNTRATSIPLSSTQFKQQINANVSYKCSFYTRFRKIITKIKLTVTNFYLINLAIVDFLFLLCIPFVITTIILRRWIFGLILCKMYFSIVYICQFNAAFIICILSFDRWLAVRFPLKIKSYRNLFIARLIIFFSWLLAVLFTLPMTLKATEEEQYLTKNNSNGTIMIVIRSCYLDWPNTWKSFFFENLSPLKAFQLYSFTFNYLIPVSLTIMFYIQVLRKINSKKLVHSKNRVKSYRKITRMVLAVIGCYVVCWTPFWLLQMVLTIVGHNDLVTILSNLTQLVAYLNSALNPILYSYLSENFRSNFKLTFLNGRVR